MVWHGIVIVIGMAWHGKGCHDMAWYNMEMGGDRVEVGGGGGDVGCGGGGGGGCGGGCR